MRQLEEYFHAIAPATLFHYTGIGSVLGMSKTRTLWASSAYYLNDSREVIHACSILDEVLEPRMIFGNLIPADLEFLTQLKEWKNDFQKNHYNIESPRVSWRPFRLSQAAMA